MIMASPRRLQPQPLPDSADRPAVDRLAKRRAGPGAFAGIARRPYSFGLACAAALLLVLISEVGYRKSVANLDALVAPTSAEAAEVSGSRQELYRTLLLGRIGAAGLSAVSLLAWAMYLRQANRLRGQRVSHRLVGVECDRLEVEVGQQTALLIELTQHLQTVREDERGRLARDLHDELGSLLTSAKLDAARLRSRLTGNAAEALPVLAHLVAMLDAGIALKRDIVEALRPSALDTLGLVDALDILARDFAERSGVAVHQALGKVALTPTAELVVYRLVQEAITNIIKYARAKQVWVAMAARDGRIEVTVRDDGVGFDSAAPLRSAYGLVGMRYRVEAERGTMAVDSMPGRGTLIRVSLPQRMAAAACSA